MPGASPALPLPSPAGTPVVATAAGFSSVSGAAVPPPPAPDVQVAPDAVARTPVFVEVFCGMARLSKAARALGFKAVPVDHVCKANGIKVLLVDVSTKSGQAQLKGLLENPDVRWVLWAPPCGTFSR